MIKNIYVVFGYRNTGSGSLTFPEDFDTPGFYEDEKDAQDHCDRLNKETLEEIGNPEDEDGNPITDIFELECDDFMVYIVDTLKNLKE